MALYEPRDGIFKTREEMAEACSSSAACGAGLALTLVEAGETKESSSSKHHESSNSGDYNDGSASDATDFVLPTESEEVRGGGGSDPVAEGGVLLVPPEAGYSEVKAGPIGVNRNFVDGGEKRVDPDVPLLWWILFVCSKAPAIKSSDDEVAVRGAAVISPSVGTSLFDV